jgi:hypothetical protein
MIYSSNIDAHFQAHRFLMFPSKSIHTDGIRAGAMVSIDEDSASFPLTIPL